MSEIINIREHQIKRKHKNLKSADAVTKSSVEALLHKQWLLSTMLMPTLHTLFREYFQTTTSHNLIAFSPLCSILQMRVLRKSKLF